MSLNNVALNRACKVEISSPKDKSEGGKLIEGIEDKTMMTEEVISRGDKKQMRGDNWKITNSDIQMQNYRQSDRLFSAKDFRRLWNISFLFRSV